MADGRNGIRAHRILEVANDFRTLQLHISTYVTAAAANPPDAASQALAGYRLFQQCRVEAQRLLAVRNDAVLNIQPANVAATEAQRVQLQRNLLDISTRRFQAHKVYLRVAAARRWVMGRTQVLQGPTPTAAALQEVDRRLAQDLAAITDQYIFTNLRTADGNHKYWIEEDPTLAQIQAWARTQQ